MHENEWSSPKVDGFELTRLILRLVDEAVNNACSHLQKGLKASYMIDNMSDETRLIVSDMVLWFFSQQIEARHGAAADSIRGKKSLFGFKAESEIEGFSTMTQVLNEAKRTKIDEVMLVRDRKEALELIQQQLLALEEGANLQITEPMNWERLGLKDPLGLND